MTIGLAMQKEQLMGLIETVLGPFKLEIPIQICQNEYLDKRGCRQRCLVAYTEKHLCPHVRVVSYGYCTDCFDIVGLTRSGVCPAHPRTVVAIRSITPDGVRQRLQGKPSGLMILPPAGSAELAGRVSFGGRP